MQFYMIKNYDYLCFYIWSILTNTRDNMMKTLIRINGMLYINKNDDDLIYVYKIVVSMKIKCI